MKLLIVGFPSSPHAARWVRQLDGQGWDVRIFPSDDSGATCSEFSNVKIYHTFYCRKYNKNKNVNFFGIPILGDPKIAFAFRFLLQKIFPNYQKKYLRRVIEEFEPDVIHSMEFQHAAYLVDEVRSISRGEFPKWIATNWGSDIFYFGRFEKHKQKIKSVLTHCNFYSCECERDIRLALDLGLNKEKCLPVFPNSGGYDLDKLGAVRNTTLPSKRKAIILKGYQGWAGRALDGLKALDLCGEMIKGYNLIIYSIQPKSGVDSLAKELAKKYSMQLTIIPSRTSHDRILQYQSTARVSIGLSISDGISTMVLESMVMGSFPIQSNTSSADEWIESGKTGMIVPPEDPELIAKSIMESLTNDNLVDSASQTNWEVALKRLGSEILKEKTLNFYQIVINKNLDRAQK